MESLLELSPSWGHLVLGSCQVFFNTTSIWRKIDLMPWVFCFTGSSTLACKSPAILVMATRLIAPGVMLASLLWASVKAQDSEADGTDNRKQPERRDLDGQIHQCHLVSDPSESQLSHLFVRWWPFSGNTNRCSCFHSISEWMRRDPHKWWSVGTEALVSVLPAWVSSSSSSHSWLPLAAGQVVWVYDDDEQASLEVSGPALPLCHQKCPASNVCVCVCVYYSTEEITDSLTNRMEIINI